MFNLTEAQLDLLLFIGPPVFVLLVLVCVVVQLWRGVRNEHLNPDEPDSFK